MQTNNKLKRQSGFTLVEVIVVAIIVAALAGVAIPMYTSYVTSSRTNAAANAAGSVASFAGACMNQSGDVTGVTVNTETSGAAAILLECKTGAGFEADGTTPLAGTAISSMQLPSKIKFKLTKLDHTSAAPGKVEATHLDGGTMQSYNY